ncbi:MAG: ribokinase [Alphaproteobacteria bacterium]|nr:ribokinase [Alphaproteobacteria bacterium]
MIIVLGSINIDLVTQVEHLPRPGETVMGEAYQVVPGGKGANQALAARRAGAAVKLIGCVGADAFADTALASLRAAGVDLSGVTVTDANTGLAKIAVDRAGENLIIVAGGANRSVHADQLAAATPRPDDVLLLQMEIPHDQNWAAVAQAKQRGARVVLNLAPAGPVPPETLAGIDVLIMNETEADQLAGHLGRAAADRGALNRDLARDFDLASVISLGAQGAIASTRDRDFRLPALPTDVVDTTAAGDAFVGALSAALDAGLDLEPALQRGIAAGALACRVVGAQTSIPDAAAIDRLLSSAPS